MFLIKTKGIKTNKGKGLVLLSDLIKHHLKIPCAVVMGANRAGEVAGKKFGEATVGSTDLKFGKLIKKYLQVSKALIIYCYM